MMSRRRGWPGGDQNTTERDSSKDDTETILDKMEILLKYYKLPIQIPDKRDSESESQREFYDEKLLESGNENSGFEIHTMALTGELSDLLKSKGNFSTGYIEPNSKVGASGILWVAAKPFLWLIEVNSTEKRQVKFNVNREVKTIFRCGANLVVSYDSSLVIVPFNYDEASKLNLNNPSLVYTELQFEENEYIVYGNEKYMASSKGRIFEYKVDSGLALTTIEGRRRNDSFIVTKIIELDDSLYVLHKERLRSKITLYTNRSYKHEYSVKDHRITDIVAYKQTENEKVQKILIAIQNPGSLLEMTDSNKLNPAGEPQPLFQVKTENGYRKDMASIFGMGKNTVYTWSSNGILFCHDIKDASQTDIVVARLNGKRAIFFDSLPYRILTHGPIANGYVALTTEGITVFREKELDAKADKWWFICREIGNNWLDKPVSKNVLFGIKQAVKAVKEWTLVERKILKNQREFDLALFERKNACVSDVFSRKRRAELMQEVQNKDSNRKINSLDTLNGLLEEHTSVKEFISWKLVICVLWVITLCLILLDLFFL